MIITGVGQADDLALISNNLYNLLNALNLTVNYCKKFRIELNHEKTKLLRLSSNRFQQHVHFNPISLYGQHIDFSDVADHVGVVRSVEGNLPHILNRIVSHKKCIAAVLFTGIAANHRGNLAAAVKLEKMYCLPVLHSGTASLVISSAESNMISLALQEHN